MLTFPLFLKSAGYSKGHILKTPTSNGTSNGRKGNNLVNQKPPTTGSKRAIGLVNNAAAKTQATKKGKENANPSQMRRRAPQHTVSRYGRSFEHKQPNMIIIILTILIILIILQMVLPAGSHPRSRPPSSQQARRGPKRNPRTWPQPRIALMLSTPLPVASRPRSQVTPVCLMLTPMRPAPTAPEPNGKSMRLMLSMRRAPTTPEHSWRIQDAAQSVTS